MNRTLSIIMSGALLLLQPREAKSVSSTPEHLRSVLARIAPLEEWEFSWVNREPRICWKFFRAQPGMLNKVLHIVQSFQGHSTWVYVDGCLEPVSGKTFIAAPNSGARAIPDRPSPFRAPRPQLTREQAAEDIEQLADHIESELHLEHEQAKLFSKDLLSRNGLRNSHGAFEDFQEGGQRIVYLIVHPGTSPVFEPTDTDIMLHFEPQFLEMPVIFGDIVGSDLTHRDFGELTEAEAQKIENEFPTLWKISDYHEDAYLSPLEAGSLLRECLALDKTISSPEALRGLDKLSRIAYWASEKGYGVLFSAP